MAFDYKAYQEKKKKKAIDISKFLPTGTNRDNVDAYLKKDGIKKVMNQSAEDTKNVLADFGMSTSVTKNIGYVVRDAFSNLANVAGKAFDNIKQPFTKEGREAAEKRGILSEYEYNQRAEIASQAIGEDIKPDQYSERIKTATPEQLQLARSLKTEKNAEDIAKVATAPIRLLPGALATGVVSYALERADSDGKYTPKTDAEKLLIGDRDIQRLTKQDDLYGMAARGIGIPAAITIMAILENPFIAGTGLNKLAKEMLEKKIKNITIEQATKIGTKELDSVFKSEIDKTMNELAEAGLKNGSLTEEQANILLKQTGSFKVKQLEAPTDKKLLPARTVTKQSPEISGDGFTFKPVASAVDTRLAKFNADYQKKLDAFNAKPTPKTLEAVKLSREKYFKVKEALEIKPVSAETAAKADLPTIKTEPIPTNSKIPGVADTGADAQANFKTTIADQATKTSDDIKALGNNIEAPKTPKLSKDLELKITNTEKEVGDQFKDLPSYNARKIKVQDETITELMKNDIGLARAMIRGEKEIPDNISPAYLFKKMEDYAEKTSDVKIMRELSRSRVSSDISQGASELRLIAERNEYSPVRIIEDIRNARAKKAAPKNKKPIKDFIAKEKKAIKDKARYEAKKAIKIDDWQKFIDEIRC